MAKHGPQTVFTPFAINDHGWIVGVGWKAGTPAGGAPLLLKPR